VRRRSPGRSTLLDSALRRRRERQPRAKGRRVSRHRTLRMDFAERGERASPERVVLLLAGAAAMALAAAAYQDVQTRTANVESELGRLGNPSAAAPDSRAAGAYRPDEAVRRANVVARELARRWDQVFAAIEAAGDADVGLLAIEPDAQKGIVR